MHPTPLIGSFIEEEGDADEPFEPLISEPGEEPKYDTIGTVEGDRESMQRELEHIDISNVPELLRIAEEVHTTKQPRILSRNNEDVAVLMPLTSLEERRAQGEKTEADYEAFLSAAGSWNGLIDADKLIADIRESRRHSSRPPVEL